MRSLHVNKSNRSRACLGRLQDGLEVLILFLANLEKGTGVWTQEIAEAFCTAKSRNADTLHPKVVQLHAMWS